MLAIVVDIPAIKGKAPQIPQPISPKKKSFKENFDKLWIHGFLHLVGHKHKKNNDYYKMNKLEKLIFSKIQKK